MSHIAAASLFDLAIMMRAAYPHRSSYDRGSALTVDLAVSYAERLLRTSRQDASAVATDLAWQPGRDA